MRAMPDPHATDFIDRHGFRANVGIVLTRDTGELFLGGPGWRGEAGNSRRAGSTAASMWRKRCFGS